MNWYVVGAVLAALLAVGMLALSRKARAQHRTMYLTETTTTGTLRALQEAATAAAGAGAFQQPVELSGTAVAGPIGLLTSELAKAPCVWHHHRVTRKFQTVTRDAKGNRQTSTSQEVVTQNVTSDRFLLRDADGEITVLPGNEIDGARKTLSEFREGGQGPSGHPGDSDTLGYTYEEWVLAPDTRIFVQGEATDRDGDLVVAEPEGKGKLSISTRSERALLKDADRHAKVYGRVAVGAAAVGVALLALAVVA